MKISSKSFSNKHSSSFRDPSGYVFLDNKVLKRVVLPKYFTQYHALKKSGFYQKAMQHGLLIPHTESKSEKDSIELIPEEIPFISYPYEWSFNQLKDAALHTLKLQKYAVNNGFVLKDASAFNIAFHHGKTIFIDTLSFDFYTQDSPWKAFKMFVQHFLSPLVLAYYHGASILKLLQTHIDGIPLSLTSSLLPWKSKLSPMIYTNIHLLAKAELKYINQTGKKFNEVKVKKERHLNHLDALYSFIQGLKINQQTEWGNYYDNIHYNDTSLTFKKNQISEWVSYLGVKTVVDVGGNDGTMVRSFHNNLDFAIVGDIDENAVDLNYQKIKEQMGSNIIPLLLDILQPTPALGFNSKERFSIIKRLSKLNPDLTLALALVHHISLSGNVPFLKTAEFFARFSNYLIIEFPNRDDDMVQLLLNQKRDFKNHFDFYSVENFEKDFGVFFEIKKRVPIPKSNRILYQMEIK